MSEHGIDLSMFDLEGIDVSSLNLDKIDTRLSSPIGGSATPAGAQQESRYGVADMTNIARLNEKSVVNNLLIRFQNEIIYTYIGSVLVSVNPFKALPGLFDSAQTYRGKTLMEQAPHIFALTEKAYSAMLNTQTNQAFLISGESGAGKTEAMKKILAYLSAICPLPEVAIEEKNEKPIHEMVIHANPILENFGNAKTVHNKNSSRFGKFTEIQFDQMGAMVGAKICDYLLEKTRIVHQSQGERNYHIFYRILVGASEQQKVDLDIKGKTANDFAFLNMGQSIQVLGLNDVDEYKELEASLKMFLSPVLIEGMWKIIATVLHMGNIDFDGTVEKVKKCKNENHVATAARLLGVEESALIDLLTNRYTIVGKESYKNPRRMKEAYDIRNSFCKGVYARLFKWVVARLNDALCIEEPAYFLGLLDIFGFEVFKYNDLEQFCINFANEALQDLFNEYIFKTEQEAYKAEELKVKPIQWVDNELCLQLMSAPRTGIFDLLDDQGKLSNGTTDSFMHGMEEAHKKHPNFSKDRRRRHAVVIKHYAGKVTYDVVNWIEKNVESTPQEVNEMIKESNNVFLQAIFAEGTALQRKPSKGPGSRPMMRGGRGAMTVTAQFKKSLSELLDTLKKTSPFFIRCLKPNGEQVRDRFDQNYILTQMRSVGMLDTIQIRKSGYPVRYEYADFLKRYVVILPEDKRKELHSKKLNNTDMTEAILKELQISTEDFALGITRLFMKDMPADRLENRYHAIQTFRMRKIKNAIRMQKRQAIDANKEISEEHKKEDLALGLTDETIKDPDSPSTPTTPRARGVQIKEPEAEKKTGTPSPRAVKELQSRARGGTMRRRNVAASPTTPGSPLQTTGSADVIMVPAAQQVQQVQMLPAITTDASVKVEIAKLFITDEGETRKVTFTGVRSEQEFQRLFRHTFPNHTFPTPFPRIYVKDPIANVSYEVTDYGEIGEGYEVKCNRVSVNVTSKLEELNLKLERGFDVVKDHMRILSSGGGLPTGASAASGTPIVKTKSKNNLDGTKTAVSMETLEDHRRNLHNLRRDVAICKQTTRDLHEVFQRDLKTQFEEILLRVGQSMTPIQIKRAQLSKNKTDIVEIGLAIKKDMDELDDLVSDTHTDMIKRKIKPADVVHETINSRFLEIETKYNAVNSKYDTTLEGFEKLWDIEKNMTQEEKDVLTVDTNNTLCDVEEVYDHIVANLEEIRFHRAHRDVDIPIIDSYTEESLDDTVDNIMDEIAMTRVNNDARVKAMAKMEEKMKQRKEIEKQSDPLVQFTNDLSQGKFSLKKTGGFEELERLRKQKEAEIGMLGSVMD